MIQSYEIDECKLEETFIQLPNTKIKLTSKAII